MSESNVTTAAIRSHSSALERSGSQHLANGGRCRAWSAGMVVAVIVFGVAKAQAAVLPWVAGVVGLLALADACCVALARRAVEAYHRFMARVPLNGGNLPKAEEWLVLPGPDLGIRDAMSVLRALGSFSVWPFHAGLLTLVLGFWLNSAPPAGSASGTKATSSNKPIPATHVLSAPTPRPVGITGQPPGQPPGQPMQPGQPGQFGKPLPPGQAPVFSPQKPGQTPPAARIPAFPPRPAQPGVPPSSAPANGVSPNGVSPNGASPGSVPTGSAPTGSAPTGSAPSGGPASGTAPSGNTPANAVPPATAPASGSPAKSPAQTGALQNAVPPQNTAPAPAAGGTPVIQPAPAPAPAHAADGTPVLPAGAPPAK